MAISLANAIKSVKEDEHWVKKVLIGGVITAIAVTAGTVMQLDNLSAMPRIIGFIAYVLFGAFLSGFLLSTGNKMLNSDSNSMTEWSEPNLLIKGLKFMLSILVYCLVMTLIFTLISIVLSVVFGIILAIIYAIIIALFHIDAQALSPLIVVIGTVFGIVFGLYFMQFINAAYTSYYQSLNFRNLMALKKHFYIIKENQHAAWTLIGKGILYLLLFILLYIVACITVIGILVVPFITFAAYVVMINLYAQYGKEIEIGKYFE